jgi:FkbM family methyltransferase
MRQQLQEWRQSGGDSIHRVNYDLSKDSLVFDIGGFKGEWSHTISKKYNCDIYIFEPVKTFFDQIKNKFKDNKKIKVYNLGLYSETKEEFISVAGDSSSHVNQKSGNSEKIQLQNVVEFLKEKNVSYVDLAKINIEGAEYDLINKLIDNNVITVFNNLQVQFHNFIPDATSKLLDIRSKLEKTHELTYCYDFVWENWKLKDNFI